MLVSNFSNFSLESNKAIIQCVCGCSSLAALKKGEHVSYCPPCAKKRENYAKKITGEIHLDENNSFPVRLINSIEDLRKKETTEILYKRIDRFFVQRAKNNYEEPYEDSGFTVQMYREKVRVVDQFSNKVEQHCKTNMSSNQSQVSTYYQIYQIELSKMKKNDIRCIHDLENGRSNLGIKKR